MVERDWIVSSMAAQMILKGQTVCGIRDVLTFARETENGRAIVQFMRTDSEGASILRGYGEEDKLPCPVIDQLCAAFANRVQNLLDFNMCF